MVDPYQLNLRHVGAILAIADQGSISRASAVTNMSQPALTQALSKLEAQLGHRLFERRYDGAEQTDAGRLFLTRARRGIARLVEGGRRVRRAVRQRPIPHFERSVSMGHLRGLAAVERAGSYALAARAVGLSQPSVHRAVSELEAVFDLPLIIREGRSMRVTSAGQRLVTAIRVMAAEIQSGLDELAALLPQGGGSIRIGTLPLPRAGLLPAALAEYCKSYPFTKVAIVEGPYTELLTALREGEIHLLLGALRERLPTRDVVQTSLYEDDLFIVGRKGHPLTGTDPIAPPALARFPWLIAAPGAPMRAVWDGMFEGLQQPATQLECGSILVARGLLLEGDWLALMSRDQFRVEQHAGLLAPIGGAVLGSRRAIGVATRSDWLPTGEETAFIAALQSAARSRSSAN